MSCAFKSSLMLVAFLAVSVAAPVLADSFFMADQTAEHLPPEPLPDPEGNNADTLDTELVDVDMDGDLDLVLVEGSAGPVGFPNRLYINDGAGHFTDESFRFPANNANSTEIEFADVDCDGDLDAAVSNLTFFIDLGAPGSPNYVAIAGANELLLNDGAGNFSPSPMPLPQNPAAPFIELIPPGGIFLEITSEAQFVDFDSDGDPDILFANENPFDPSSGGQNRALENTGNCSGMYIEVTDTQMPQIVDQTQGFRPADLEGDGDEDVVVIGAGPNYLLRNMLVEGSPGYVQEFTIGPSNVNVNSTRNALLVDLNGDGHLDLVEANSRDTPNEVYFGDGTGSFTHAPGAIPAENITHTDVDAADLDNDGDIDLFFTSPGGFLAGHGFLGEVDTYLRNDGHGFFRDKTKGRFEVGVTTSTDSSFGDVDGDGDLDMVTAASGAGPVGNPQGGLDRLFINDEEGDQGENQQ